MRCILALRLYLLAAALIATVGFAPNVRAGDPVPDIDVTIEQIPGDNAHVALLPPVTLEGDSRPGVEPARFDEVRIDVGRKTAKATKVGDLPRGWTLERDGKTLTLRGPLLTPPARLSLQIEPEARPETLNIELRRGGNVLVERRRLVPRQVPQRQVRGTLGGVVQMPPEVSPGETLALRPLDDTLPDGGRFTISGVVSEPFTEEDLAYARKILNTTRSNIRRQAAILPGPLTLLGSGDCEKLAPPAAMAAIARDVSPEGETWELRPAATTAGSSSSKLSNLTQHDVSMETIRPIRSFFAIKEEGVNIAIKEEGVNIAEPTGQGEGIAIKEEGVNIAIKEEGVNIAEPTGQGEGIAIKEEGVNIAEPTAIKEEGVEAWSVNSAGTSWVADWQWTAVPDLDDPHLRTVALAGEPVAGGCRFTGREASELELIRWARTAAGGGPPDLATALQGATAVVHLVQLSEHLNAGDSIAVDYLDTWGDPWVEVPAAEGVEVAPPSPFEASSIEVVAEHAPAGDLVCVCGTFSPLDMAAPFTIGAATAQVVSVGSQVVWLQLDANASPGEQLVRAEGIGGGGVTRVIRVTAELDQERLFTGGSTGLRIRVEGTDQPQRIHLTNRSPGVIQLSGGDQQTTETSGGTPNQLTREVRATQRGSFDLNWSLDPASCPCEEVDGEASPGG